MKAFAAPSSSSGSCGPAIGGSAGDGGRDDPNRGKKAGDAYDFRPFLPDQDEDDDTPLEDENGEEIELR